MYKLKLNIASRDVSGSTAHPPHGSANGAQNGAAAAGGGPSSSGTDASKPVGPPRDSIADPIGSRLGNLALGALGPMRAGATNLQMKAPGIRSPVLNAAPAHSGIPTPVPLALPNGNRSTDFSLFHVNSFAPSASPNSAGAPSSATATGGAPSEDDPLGLLKNQRHIPKALQAQLRAELGDLEVRMEGELGLPPAPTKATTAAKAHHTDSSASLSAVPAHVLLEDGKKRRRRKKRRGPHGGGAAGEAAAAVEAAVEADYESDGEDHPGAASPPNHEHNGSQPGAVFASAAHSSAHVSPLVAAMNKVKAGSDSEGEADRFVQRQQRRDKRKLRRDNNHQQQAPAQQQQQHTQQQQQQRQQHAASPRVPTPTTTTTASTPVAAPVASPSSSSSAMPSPSLPEVAQPPPKSEAKGSRPPPAYQTMRAVLAHAIVADAQAYGNVPDEPHCRFTVSALRHLFQLNNEQVVARTLASVGLAGQARTVTDAVVADTLQNLFD